MYGGLTYAVSNVVHEVEDHLEFLWRLSGIITKLNWRRV